MVQLELHLFGPPRVLRSGQIVEFGLRKALALFLYLAATKQPHSRDALATLFWPDDDQRGARGKLRRALYRISGALGADLLMTAGDTVGLSPHANLWIDVALFEHCLAGALPKSGSAAQPPETAVARLAEAVELYTGDFLAGFTLPDCPAFDDWQFFRREELRHSLAKGLEQLVQQYEQAHNFDCALLYARRWLALDPLHEPVHRHLMQLYARSGQQSAALRQYAECQRILQEELGGPPEPETVALHEAIRTKQFPPHGEQVGAPPSRMEPLPVRTTTLAGRQQDSVTAAPLRAAVPRHNLPAQPTPFVGRKEEVAEILSRLRNPACHLLTLTGPGGVGKTRLALQIGQLLWERAASEPFIDGIFYVGLTNAQSSGEICPAIATTVGLDLYSDRPVQEQVLDYLSSCALLLILDNFDQVLDGAELVAQLVAAAPNLKLLVTSREALNLAEEWFHPITGLSYPATDAEPLQSVAGYGAVQLFEQCAHRARIDFSLAQEEAHVLRICRMVDGLPLALELAAAWLKTLSAATIADEIERGIDILTTQQRNVPERHRSMRAVLEQSWALLSEIERTVLTRFAIFRGGVRRQAAREVAGATVLTLGRLVDKSLVRATPSGRFQLHELLRQFAAEQLAARPEDEAKTRTLHSRYYLQFLAQYDQSMYNQQLQGALADVAEDLENIRTAWDWAIAQGDLEVLEPAIVALYRFFWTRSRGREGADLFARSLVQLEQATGVQNHPRYEFVRRSLIHQRGMFYYFLGDYEAAEQDMIWSLVLARKLALQTPLGDALVILGAISVWQGDWSTALERLRESYTIFEQIGHRDGLADVLQELSMHHLHFGEFARGKALATESLTICHELDRPDWTAWAHDALGWSCFLLGEYEVARTHYETSLAIFDRLGHERGRALALGGFGMVAWAQGGEQLGHAKGWLQQSLEICRKIGFRLHIASRLAMMALVLNELGDYQAAQAHAQDGLALASETGSRLFIVYNLFCLVETAYRQADFFTARGYLREVLMLTSQTGLLPSLASGLYHAGVLLALEVQQAVVDAAAAPSQLARAVQLLTLVAQHPACWSAFRTRAQQKLTQFVVQLPAELSPAVQAQSRMLDLHSAAEDLLALL